MFIYLFIYSSPCLFICLSIHLFNYSSPCLFICLSIHLIKYSSTCLFIYLSIHLFKYLSYLQLKKVQKPKKSSPKIPLFQKACSLPLNLIIVISLQAQSLNSSTPPGRSTRYRVDNTQIDIDICTVVHLQVAVHGTEQTTPSQIDRYMYSSTPPGRSTRYRVDNTQKDRYMYSSIPQVTVHSTEYTTPRQIDICTAVHLQVTVHGTEQTTPRQIDRYINSSTPPGHSTRYRVDNTQLDRQIYVQQYTFRSQYTVQSSQYRNRYMNISTLLGRSTRYRIHNTQIDRQIDRQYRNIYSSTPHSHSTL